MTHEDERWTPPRGAVTITEEETGTLSSQNRPVLRYTASCRACGWTYVNSVKSDVQMQKSHHRCPVGTADAYPPCPECKSRKSKCMRPSGHESWQWHAARVRLYEGMQ